MRINMNLIDDRLGESPLGSFECRRPTREQLIQEAVRYINMMIVEPIRRSQCEWRNDVTVFGGHVNTPYGSVVFR